MPVGEPTSELIPDRPEPEDVTNTTIAPEELLRRIQLAKITYDTTARSPQFSASIKEVRDSLVPTYRALLNGVQNGSVGIEEAIRFLSQDRAIASEAANMDDLSETYRRQHLEKRLDAILEKLGPDETVEVNFYDLVNFKNVNDAATLQGGDRVLKEAAGVFRRRHPKGTGGRIGDEFVFFELRKKAEVAKNTTDLESEAVNMPKKLMDAPIRGGESIPIYIHQGRALYDPTIDVAHTEEKEVNGNRVTEITTRGKSLINRANALADANKALNKKAHPELYVARQSSPST